MSVKTKDVNSNIVKKEERGVLDDHALKVEKFVKTELNLKPYLQDENFVYPMSCGIGHLDLRQGLSFSLNAPKSLQENVTYLCQDQPYQLKLHYLLPIGPGYRARPMAITSIVSVQFCSTGDKTLEDVTQCWELWASHHPYKSPRILEVENAYGFAADTSLALNTVKIVWLPGCESPVIDVVIKCLSFTAKEALDGLPLQLQIDSYIENQILNESGILGPRLVNRAFCTLKAFVRPQLRNGRLQEHIANAVKHQPLKPVSIFCTAELEQLKDPVFFKIRYVKDLVNRMPVETIETPEVLVMFVKQNSEEVFNTLVCSPGNLNGFVLAFGLKFAVKPKDIRGLFKASATDVVEVDDSEFPSLSNRTFKMQVTATRIKNRDMYDIILYDC